MAAADRNGHPIAVQTESASPHEVIALVQATLEQFSYLPLPFQLFPARQARRQFRLQRGAPLGGNGDGLVLGHRESLLMSGTVCAKIGV